MPIYLMVAIVRGVKSYVHMFTWRSENLGDEKS